MRTPGFRASPGRVHGGGRRPARDAPAPVRETTARPYGTGPTPPAGSAARRAPAALDRVAAHEDELGRLDAVAGDGDHGIGIVRGLRAAVAAARTAEPGPARDPPSAGTALLTAGLALADASGGASGALYGALLTETGGRARQRPRRRRGAPGSSRCADAVDAAQRAVTDLGGARPARRRCWTPWPRSAGAAGAGGGRVAKAWQAAAEAATGRRRHRAPHPRPRPRGPHGRPRATATRTPEPSRSRCSSPRSAKPSPEPSRPAARGNAKAPAT